MVVVFEQEIVNGSEGNVAVVCASAFFPLIQGPFSLEGPLQLMVDVSIVDQGSAGEAMIMHDVMSVFTILNSQRLVTMAHCHLT